MKANKQELQSYAAPAETGRKELYHHTTRCIRWIEQLPDDEQIRVWNNGITDHQEDSVG